MTEGGASSQLESKASAGKQGEVVGGAVAGPSSEGRDDMPASSEPQVAAVDEAMTEATQEQAALPTEADVSSAQADSQTSEEAATTIDADKPTDASVSTEATTTNNLAAPPEEIEASTYAADEEGEADTTAEQDDTDFVPPDMEHIVSTGATQDGASSMQALRELVAQARASSGQPREALPPGFGDDDDNDDEEASLSPPIQAPRGEKRKAEAELAELVQASTGIEEVKAAAEKSQHPETKTLLQKALSSISGLVSRRSKAEPAAATLASTQSEQAADSVKDGGAEADSSDDSDSDSDSDSSSSDSSDDEDDGDDAPDAGLALAGDDDDDEDGGASGSVAPVTKNEILAPEVEQPKVQEITEAEKQTLRKLGKVHSIVDSVVVVEQDVQQSKQPDAAHAGPVPVDSTGRQGEREGEYSVLDTGSLLCFDDGKVLGLVFETFGSIHNPMYSIRFASAATIDRDVVKTGKPVFYLPAQSTYVLTQLLRSMKGSDASNMWDEEVAEDEIDYSDDEQEAEAKRRAKAIRTGKVDDQGNPIAGASGRGNKRQKNGGAGPSAQNSHHSANGSFRERTRTVSSSNGGFAPGQPSQPHRPNVNPSLSQPRRSVGSSNLPMPPVPTGPASLGPAFPHGLAKLPPKPSAGLPSRPNFQSEAASATNRPSSDSSSGNATPDSQAATAAPRSRMSTAEGTASGPGHSRMHSAAASGLPAKPVDAAAAAAAMSSATAKTGAAASPYRGPAGAVGVSSPPHPSRPASMGRPPAAAAPGGAYPHQGSPGWYAGSGSGSAPSSTPASPAQPSQHAGPRVLAYSPGVGAQPPAQGGHYNPAYSGHWQQHYAPGSTAAPSAHPAAGMAWSAPQAYHPPPLHLAPGSMSQPPYGGYGAPHGSYAAPSGAPWTAQVYPGSHYPGYTDASAASQHYHNPSSANTTAGHAQQGLYNPSAQAYGGGYGVSYGAAGTHPSGAAGATSAPPAQDSYDPRSPSMGGGGNNHHHQAQQQNPGSQGR